MPELPEVETVVRDLRPAIVGREIVRVTAGHKRLRNPWSPAWSCALAGQRIQALGRRGKWITAECDRGQLLIHLGMTGQLTVGPADRRRESHTHLSADLDDGAQIRFRDIRRFGSATYFPNRDDLHRYLADRLGPEPFEIDPRAFRIAVQGCRRPLKAILLDQSVIAGIGNIYADESLFVARLSPRQLGCRTTGQQCRRLREAMVSVLQSAIDFRGSTIRNYVGGSGLSGTFQNEFRVYGRKDQPCSRCRWPIAVVRLAGRSTHFCPRCQTSLGKRKPAQI
jgi:formamidopyrimidine-DNA glycosylase